MAGTSSPDLVVRLSAASTNVITVNYATSQGTAAAGIDFRSANGKLTFSAGETQKTIRASIVGDATIESTETFSIVLSSATNATILDGTGLVTILDNDSPPPTEGVPAKPITFVRDDVGNDGKFTIGFNVWSGVNGTSWQLLEKWQRHP
ncbi:MAG: Calx-beta domain-containing protein [Planctomycetota bacterium]